MKYIRTYETEEKFLTDKDSTSRGFRLKPTLYKYSEAGDHVHLELDDPRKHEGSTYMEIALSSDVEFSFYIGNKSGDTQTTMNCSIDWGDGTIETKTITKDNKGFKLVHNYVAGSYKIELYDVEREYSMVGDTTNEESLDLISPPEGVKRVVLSDGVVSIGDRAFRNCSSLTSIFIPEGVTNIGTAAFSLCKSLTSVYIPESVTSMGAESFSGCFSLKSIYIPNSVVSIQPWTFGNCGSLTSVHIPESVTSMGGAVFTSCYSLKSVHIPESITMIWDNTFQYCASLTSIHIPESVTIIRPAVFTNCSSLKSIDIPEKVTSIGDRAFQNCSSLKSIDIPERVTSIGDNVFRDCSSLTSISSFNTTAPTLGNDVFTNLPTNGILHVKPGATGYDAWLSKLPSGWTIAEDL